jgi:hypothetical protein
MKIGPSRGQKREKNTVLYRHAQPPDYSQGFLGNVHRAELMCVCGRRFEGFAAGKFGRVYPAKTPSEFWVAYDAGKLGA